MPRFSQAHLPGRLDVAPEDDVQGVARTLKAVQLRLLMREREEAGRRLADLDYEIWILEEFFRGRNR
jgi:hypothetical protein